MLGSNSLPSNQMELLNGKFTKERPRCPTYTVAGYRHTLPKQTLNRLLSLCKELSRAMLRILGEGSPSRENGETLRPGRHTSLVFTSI